MAAESARLRLAVAAIAGTALVALAAHFERERQGTRDSTNEVTATTVRATGQVASLPRARQSRGS